MDNLFENRVLFYVLFMELGKFYQLNRDLLYFLYVTVDHYKIYTVSFEYLFKKWRINSYIFYLNHYLCATAKDLIGPNLLNLSIPKRSSMKSIQMKTLSSSSRQISPSLSPLTKNSKYQFLKLIM